MKEGTSMKYICDLDNCEIEFHFSPSDRYEDSRKILKDVAFTCAVPILEYVSKECCCVEDGQACKSDLLKLVAHILDEAFEKDGALYRILLKKEERRMYEHMEEIYEGYMASGCFGLDEATLIHRLRNDKFVALEFPVEGDTLFIRLVFEHETLEISEVAVTQPYDYISSLALEAGIFSIVLLDRMWPENNPLRETITDLNEFSTGVVQAARRARAGTGAEEEKENEQQDD